VTESDHVRPVGGDAPEPAAHETSVPAPAPHEASVPEPAPHEAPLPEVFTPVELDEDQAVAALRHLDPVTAAGLEALLFLADEPLHAVTLAETLELTPTEVDAACQGLAVRHRTERRGTEVRRAAGGWRMYSAALARPVLERWALTGRTGRLTQAALETLAVIAYKQPIARQEVGEIRGVNADGAVRSLVARGFVEEVGRADAPGQAALYGTTTTLLERLGIDSLDELPPLTDFLPEHTAPDEPELGRIKEARQRLVGGGEQLDPDRTREAATRRFGDVRARLAVAGAEAPPAPPGHDPETDEDADVLPPPQVTRDDRRADEAAMDHLTDKLEDAARSAVDRLRQAVSASEAREAADAAAAESDTSADGHDAPPEAALEVEDRG
jgi:segregation and condensation protein B